jgi:hypothetical protein
VLERRRVVDEEGDVVEIAEPPVLAGFEGLDDRVVGHGEVSGGVTVGGVVATADVAAGHAHPQMNPAAADAQAVLATVAAGRDIGDLIEVTTSVGHSALLSRSDLAAV